MWHDRLAEKWASFWKSGKNRQNSESRSRPRGNARLRGEWLEDRRLLSISPWFGAFLHGPSHYSAHTYQSSSSPTSTTPALTVTLQNHPSTSSYGQSVHLTAKVAGATNGTVEFFDGTTQLGSTVNVSSNGVANLAINTLTVGTHSITAEYFADGATTATSTSTAIPETVNPAATNIALSASSNPSLVASADATPSLTFTALVGSWGVCSATGTATNTPTGTVAFTITNEAGGAPITGTATLDSTGKATFTPSAALAAGTYDVTATFTPADGNFLASSSRTLVEKVVAPADVGVGTVTAGTSTSPVTLRGGQQLTIDLTQALDSTTNVLTETGNGITYVDSAKNINLTAASTDITSIVFSSNGHQALITGTGTNVNGSTNTPVTFTILVDSGDGNWHSSPSVRITINGTGIDYQQSGRLSAGSVSVNETGSTTTIPPQGGTAHDHALGSMWGDGDYGGFGFRHWRR
jgi:hypothetical protein